MTHRLDARTRTVIAAAAGTAMLAVADAVHTTHGAAGVTTAVVLGLAALAMLRLHEAGIDVRDDVVVVRNVLRTRSYARSDVAAFRAGTWNSRMELTDGRVVLSVLRDKDVPEPLELDLPVLIVLDVAAEQVGA